MNSQLERHAGQPSGAGPRLWLRRTGPPASACLCVLSRAGHPFAGGGWSWVCRLAQVSGQVRGESAGRISSLRGSEQEEVDFPPGSLWIPMTFFTLLLLLLLPPPPSSGCPDVCTCSSGEVDCVEHQLRFVPDSLPADATAVLLDYNRIATLRNRTFVALKALRRLSLRGNALVSVHPRALVGLSSLQELDLSGNYLRALKPETFFPVPSLATLRLEHNKLLRLDPDLLEALPHLQALAVHGNGLVSLSSGLLQNLPSLGYLKLDDNPWMCSCDIEPLFQWLVDNTDKVPEAMSVSCRLPAHLANYPIVAIGNASFAHCQEPWLQLQDYVFFLLVGPFTFFASLCICVLVGLLAVAHTKMTVVSYIRPGALARRAEHQRR